MNFIHLSILFCRNIARPLCLWGLASCGCIAIAQTFQHSLCRRKFGSVVQVGIDVGGGGEVAVPQSFLNLLHGNAICQKKVGTTMAQIVKADGAQTVFLQQLRELLGNIIGAEDVPDLVHTQTAEIVWIVTAAAQAVEGCQKDRYLQFGSICRLGQGVDLIGAVIAAFELVLFRTFDLICRV